MIAATLCDGAVCPQSTGLGGGFVMLYYKKADNKVYSVDARETAPGAASENMHHGNSAIAMKGGLSIATPGELKGLWEIYKRFGGGIEWKDLFEDTINLCREGIPVTKHLATRVTDRVGACDYEKIPLLKKMLTNSKTGQFVKEGDLMFRPKLAETLEVLQREGGDALYTGSLSKDFVEDLQKAGSILTQEDMKKYTVKIEETPVEAPLKDGMTLYSVPLPGSGPIVAYILSLLNGMLPGDDLSTDFVKIVEAFKFGFSQRTRCGDPDFVDAKDVLDLMKDQQHIEETRKKISRLETSQDPHFYGANFSVTADNGTASRVIVAANGDAAVMTGSINLYFGSCVMSPSTGIILNDHMGDFTAPSLVDYRNLPSAPANFIRPYKRPVTSMSPIIVLDENRDVRLAVGAAGGARIPTVTALVYIMNLWYNKTIKEAVDYPRVHHQLTPMRATSEFDLKRSVVEALRKAGHKLEMTKRGFYYSAVTAIAKSGGKITAANDFRRPGGLAGY
ncbi:scoloptoxin SSD14 isoform X2 [Bemisia tabaci]